MKLKIMKLNSKEFFVISGCRIDNHVLCVAVEAWGKSIWGHKNNGQAVLDIADTLNPQSVTYKWYQQLPEKYKAAIKSLQLNTSDQDSYGLGKIEETQMFVPNRLEWRFVPREVKKNILNGDCGLTRSYAANTVYGWNIWIINEDGINLSCENNADVYSVVPAMYFDETKVNDLITAEKDFRPDIDTSLI